MEHEKINTPSSPEVMAGGSRFSFYVAIAMVVVTVITSVIAFLTEPLSGPFCVEGCYEYPYTDIASRFPRDYYWMYAAMVWSVLCVVVLVSIHDYAGVRKKIFSGTALTLGAIAAAVLFVDYFVQVSVIQPSLLKGETDGIALWTQYNSHGVFIALEEVGYLLMSVSALFLAPVFSGDTKRERALKWTFLLNFLLAAGALIAISLTFGVHREYRFEVAVISIDWIAWIVAGVLLARVFYFEGVRRG